MKKERRRQYVLEVEYRKENEPVDDRIFCGYAAEAVEVWGGQREASDPLFYPFKRVRVKRLRPPKENPATILQDFYVVRTGTRYLNELFRGVDNAFQAARFVDAGTVSGLKAAERFYDDAQGDKYGYEIDRITLRCEKVRSRWDKKEKRS